METEIKIQQIFISPKHSYKQHEPGLPGPPPKEVQSIRCVAGRGIEGDRYFDYLEDYKGQISFFDLDVLDALTANQNLPTADPLGLRRNVFVRGIDLNSLIKTEFSIGHVRFRGSEECTPCFWMDEFYGEGAEEFLKGCGGLRARILNDGELSVGDAVVTVLETA